MIDLSRNLTQVQRSRICAKCNGLDLRQRRGVTDQARGPEGNAVTSPRKARSGPPTTAHMRSPQKRYVF